MADESDIIDNTENRANTQDGILTNDGAESNIGGSSNANAGNVEKDEHAKGKTIAKKLFKSPNLDHVSLR